jgi:hypothetical protein
MLGLVVGAPLKRKIKKFSRNILIRKIMLQWNWLTNIWHTNNMILMVYGVYRHFHYLFSYIVAVSFIGEGNQSTRRIYDIDTCIMILKIYVMRNNYYFLNHFHSTCLVLLYNLWCFPHSSRSIYIYIIVFMNTWH